MRFYIFNIFFAILVFFPIHAQARIDIIPQKILLEPRERSGEFTVLNLFDSKGSFRIELLSYRQNENGVYETLDAPLDPAFDPQKAVRFSPRQFSIEPGGRQKIRLSIRKPSNLPDGEYRFHIKALRFAKQEDLKSEEQTVSVKMNMGIVIPVIIQHGQVISNAKIETAALVKETPNKPEIHVTASRTGNGSILGKLEIYWQPTNGEHKKIGQITNANIFTEISNRNFKVPLNATPTGTGKILIRYSDEINKGKILDEITIQR